MLNACDFLRDGIFISTEEKRKSGATRESFMLFQHTDTTTGKVKVFKLMDNPTTLSSEDWHRVVAVFVSGQTWQFKGWKWSSPVELFKNVMGIYLTFDDRPIDNNVLSWNCKTIKVNLTVMNISSVLVTFFFWNRSSNSKDIKTLVLQWAFGRCLTITCTLGDHLKSLTVSWRRCLFFYRHCFIFTYARNMMICCCVILPE